MEEAPEKKFVAVYYLPSEDLLDPEKVVVRYIHINGDPKDGEKLRLYPKKEVLKSGFNSGVWGQNVAHHKIEIAGWALGAVDEKLSEIRETLGDLEVAEILWTNFVEKA